MQMNLFVYKWVQNFINKAINKEEIKQILKKYV